MTTLLLTSTEDSTGKTAIGIALARLAQDRGATVGYMKPKGTRLESAVGKTRDEDPMLARELLGLDAQTHQLEPVVYSPTFVQEAIRGREDPDALRERVVDSFESLREGTDLMLVEGAGRLATGGTVHLTDPEVAELLDAEVVLVSGYGDPTDVDDVLAAADAVGGRLRGVLFNGVDRAALDGLREDAVPFLAGRGVESVGVVPRDETLAGVSVADLAEEIGAEVLSEAPTDGLVEEFTVGAMGASAAVDGFRRLDAAAVVTGGDRSDIQTAAIEVAGVECLVLTGGYRPSNAVLGKATERGVPVLLVQTNTRTTVDRVAETLGSGRTRTAAAVDRMTALLEDRVDLDAVLGAGEDG
jgi:BioD-like phosphotransacetylase family protein